MREGLEHAGHAGLDVWFAGHIHRQRDLPGHLSVRVSLRPDRRPAVDMLKTSVRERLHGELLDTSFWVLVLDTFAYRNPYSNFGLRTFEGDHPDTQDRKRHQLDQMG